MLRIPGDFSGTIHLFQGLVTYAESCGTPDVTSRLARWTDPDAGGPGVLAQDWVIREAIADAALAMLPQAQRSARFSAGEVPAPDIVALTVAELLAEVNRRHEVLEQLPGALTADTVVARNPRLSVGGVHVSASQWALLVRMSRPVTPRELAVAAGMSVFTTTLQVFRLITLDMVAVAGGLPLDRRTISFTKAVAG